MTFVLLDNSFDREGCSYLFSHPAAIVRADDPADVPEALSQLGKAQAQGYYAAGFMSYELGLLFERRLAPLMPERRTAPLLWFGIFSERGALDAAGVSAWAEAQGESEYALSAVRPALAAAAYEDKFAKALDYIASGDIYQLNLTFKAKFEVRGDRLRLYRDLRRKQKVPYGAVISAPGFDILSLSPELFLRLDGRKAQTRPMKGTAPRGVDGGEDAALANWLSRDVKSRAENLMIVDLMRNDLGRVSEMGSVSVSDLFTVETYQTVLQMTSGVTATLRDGVDIETLIKAIFPPGSITGAPKMRAMEIISELEDEPRGVYTGAIGMIAPGGDCLFNVAIRTLFIDAGGKGEIGIGSGVVQDSSASAEYEECLLKMRFLTAPVPDFKLIETMKWEKARGYARLERHLARLASSAAYFSFPYSETASRDALDAHAERLEGDLHRVRLTLDAGGLTQVTSAPLIPSAPGARWRFAIAETRMNSRNVFVHHKTTRRDFYDAERERLAGPRNCQEVVFLNERGELTEGSFTNLFIEKEGVLLTPALSSGLLRGTLREELLEAGRAREETLSLRDLAAADAIWLGNSLRGLIRAEPADAFILRASAVNGLHGAGARALAAGR